MAPVNAEDATVVLGSAEANELLLNKPVETPTLDFLKQNNILIPQTEYKKDENGNIVKDSNKPILLEGEPIEAPESAYTITKVETEDDATFDYLTADEDGNLTHNYYKFELRQAEQSEGSLGLGTSKNITWTELETKPPIGTANTITVTLPNGSKYYQYTYNRPADYTDGSRINDTLNVDVNNVIFQNLKTYTSGGAIYNTQNTGININADFVGNYATLTTGRANGGAIYNSYNSTIGNITGDFINNSTDGSGGAISNSGTIGDITGDFIGNYANSSGYYDSNAGGGAIYNWGRIGNITGDFIGNYVTSGSAYGNPIAYGGAIFNIGTIGNINGDFVGNHAESYVGYYGAPNAYGGAIYNDLGTIANITGDFIGNYATSATGSAKGGAIANDCDGIIGNITGDFIGNYASGSLTYGGAIDNAGLIGDITGNFIGNYASGFSDSQGGAIYNNGTIGAKDEEGNVVGGLINSSFIGNYAKSESGTALGGAICNLGNLDVVEGVSTVPYFKLQILNDDGSVYASLYQMEALEDDLRIALEIGANIQLQLVGVDSISKSELEAEAIANGFENVDEYIEFALRGEGFLKTDPNSIVAEYDSMEVTPESLRKLHGLTLKNSNLLNNHADAKSGTAQGGAIYNENCIIKLVADNGKTMLISGNYTKVGDVVDDNAIYMSGGKLVLDTTNGSTIQINDNIDGTSYKTYIIGDEKSKLVLNNYLKNSDTSLFGTNLYLTKEVYLDGNTLNLHSGTLSMLNGQVGVSALNSLTVVGDTNFVADVDLANKEMDRITANVYGAHNGNLNVVGMNLLSDAKEGEDVTAVYFAQPELKNNVRGALELPQENYQNFTAYTPIYKYNVIYDNVNQYDDKGDGGYFVFTKGDKSLNPTTPTTPGGSTGNASDAFNPAVLATPVAAQTGATATMNQTFNFAFQNADNFMNIPYLERVAIKNANKYALSPTGDATDVGRFSPIFTKNDNASVWVKPYASFENIPLKNGPKVSNITYGTLVGYDTELIPMKRGWERVWTGYLGYNGASQHYSGVDSTQNGGLLGGTLTLYKGNFFNATTVSAGASVANNRTMYGSEDFTMLLAGIGNKTGYNIEFKEGKLIIQPSMLMSYTFVNTFDYTNAAGVRIESKPLHAIQLAPGVKFIGNTKNGWQPYIGVNMVWNLLDKSDVHANDVKLPEMSIKPYVQYGVGVQKRFKDNCMAFGQAMIQSGGRNGISLTAGFRWAIGREGKPIEKVKAPLPTKTSQVTKDNAKTYAGHSERSEESQAMQSSDVLHSKILKSRHSEQREESLTVKNSGAQQAKTLSPRHSERSEESLTRNNSTKKVIKQLSPSQKMALCGKKSTTRTSSTAILKQL